VEDWLVLLDSVLGLGKELVLGLESSSKLNVLLHLGWSMGFDQGEWSNGLDHRWRWRLYHGDGLNLGNKITYRPLPIRVGTLI
jgi:hypothetical protein